MKIREDREQEDLFLTVQHEKFMKWVLVVIYSSVNKLYIFI